MVPASSSSPVPAFPPHVPEQRQGKGESARGLGKGTLWGSVDSADGGDGWAKGA